MDKRNTIPPNTFPKEEKLKSRKAIDGLFKGGKSFFIYPYKVFFQIIAVEKPIVNCQLSIEEPQTQIVDVPIIKEKETKDLNANHQTSDIVHHISCIKVGFAVSTKNFKHAVDRNRIKRLGREAYRLNKHQLISHLEDQQFQLQVFFVFTNKSLPTFVLVQQAMQACLRKLIKNAKKNERLL